MLNTTITDYDKIEVIINRLNNLEAIVKSFIEHAEECKEKYSLEEQLNICNIQKNVLLQALTELGGVWPKGLD